MDGHFTGYASVFGVPDLGRDVVVPGAFAASLARRGPEGVRLLFQHDPAEPIGRWLSLREDARGLFAHGQLNLAVQRAREVDALMRGGGLDGLSIGFRTQRARTGRGGERRLHQVDLWEISLVTFPLQQAARASPDATPLPDAIRGLARRIAPPHARCPAAAGPRVLIPATDEAFMNAPTPIASPAPEIKGGLPALENKAARPEGGEVRSALDDLTAAFAAFKEANDTRIGQIEGRLGADVLTEEKLARIDAALDAARTRLDRISLDRARPPLGEAAPRGDGAAHEHKAAFDLYVRAGESAGLKRLEAKALSAGSGPDGGYLVPDTIERTVLTRLGQISPIRSIASVQQISGAQYKRAVSVGAPATGWAAETAPRPETAAPALAEIALPAMELYAMPAATQTLLDDAVVDLDAWLSAEVETAFAEQEGVAFVTGNGASRPRGFLSYDTVANAAWVPGKLGFVATGAAGAFPSTNPGDLLFDLIYGLRAAYRQNAGFVMNRRTQSAIRKFKDAEGNYLWQPPLAAGGAATLVGFPVTEAEAMPDPGKDSLSVAFGDFRRGYVVVDRTGMRVLRDPYSAKPYVLFYTTKRVGGGVQDFDAIKLLKFG